MLVIENAIRQCHAATPERLTELVKSFAAQWTESCTAVLESLPDSGDVKAAKEAVKLTDAKQLNA